MGRRIDELEGRLAAINDKLSGAVNHVNDDKQKFKDETEFEFGQHKLVLHEEVEGARKEFEGLRRPIHGLHVETANTVTNLQQRVVHLESNSSRAHNNKGYLPQKSMIPKNFTDKADEWSNWQEEVAKHMDTMTLGMMIVLAEIDQGRTSLMISGGARGRRSTRSGRRSTARWRLLWRITERKSKKVVMSIKDEDGSRAWQRLKQRFEPGLASSCASSRAWWPDGPRVPEKPLHR